MSSYTEITEKIADQWVAAVEQAAKSLPTGLDATKMVPGSFELPDLTKLLPSNVVPGLPNAQEVVETNYRIAERLLAAHRDFTLAVLEKSVPQKSDSE